MKHSPPSLDTLTATPYFNKRRRGLIKDEKKTPPQLGPMCPSRTQRVMLISKRRRNKNKEPIHSVSLSAVVIHVTYYHTPLEKVYWFNLLELYIQVPR